MITITENMIFEMYENSRNVEVVGNEYGIYANSVELKETFGETELTITLYSKYTDYRKVKEMIWDGATDEEVIFNESSFADETFFIDCNEEYTLEKYTYNDKSFEHTEEILKELQKDFSEGNELAVKEQIHYMIREHQLNK